MCLNSGDHDMLVPYVGTLSWIESLNLSVVDDWRPWSVEKQVAGLVVLSLGADMNSYNQYKCLQY